MQPKYYQCPNKIHARKENVDVYRRLTGRRSIPENRGYWTLCNFQPPEKGAEIVQMERVGLLKKQQFHGVDRDAEIIAQNKIWHPEANWYSGDWLHVIERADNFNPSLVYLDTTCFADHWVASSVVVKTMMLCQPQTVVLANVMLNDPRSSKQFDTERLVKNVERQVPTLELEKWQTEVDNYDYSATGKTKMMTYIFYKP